MKIASITSLSLMAILFADEDLLVIRELIDQVVAEKEGKEVHHG